MDDQAEMQSPQDDPAARMAALLEAEESEDQQEEVVETAEVEEEQEQEDSVEEQTEEPVMLKLKRGDEEVEVDIEEAKNLAQMGYDYTKKTQEVAEQRKQVEMYAQAVKAQEQAFQQQVELQNALIKEFAKVESLSDQISQFEQLDWNALSDSDPVQAQKLWIQYQTIQNKRANVAQDIQQKQQYLQQQTQQQVQMRLEQARADLLKAMPDFNADKAKELREVGKNYGFTEQELSAVSDPRYVRILADAAAYRKLQAEKASVTKKVSDKPPVVKPNTKNTKQIARARNADDVAHLRKTGNADIAAKLIERML